MKAMNGELGVKKLSSEIDEKELKIRKYSERIIEKYVFYLL